MRMNQVCSIWHTPMVALRQPAAEPSLGTVRADALRRQTEFWLSAARTGQRLAIREIIAGFAWPSLTLAAITGGQFMRLTSASGEIIRSNRSPGRI